MIVTGVDAETGAVFTVKVAIVFPAATVTEAGTVAALGSLLDKVMTVAPEADPVSVTVP